MLLPLSHRVFDATRHQVSMSVNVKNNRHLQRNSVSKPARSWLCSWRGESPCLKPWQLAWGHLSMPASLAPDGCVCPSFSLVCSLFVSFFSFCYLYILLCFIWPCNCGLNDQIIDEIMVFRSHSYYTHMLYYTYCSFMLYVYDWYQQPSFFLVFFLFSLCSPSCM